jgi:hypothetical protein
MITNLQKRGKCIESDGEKSHKYLLKFLMVSVEEFYHKFKALPKRFFHAFTYNSGADIVYYLVASNLFP